MSGLLVCPQSHTCPRAGDTSLAPIRSYLPCAVSHSWHPSSVGTDWPDCGHSPRQVHSRSRCASGRLGGAPATCASLATHVRSDRIPDRPSLPARFLNMNSTPLGSQVPRISCVSVAASTALVPPATASNSRGIRSEGCEPHHWVHWRS